MMQSVNDTIHYKIEMIVSDGIPINYFVVMKQTSFVPMDSNVDSSETASISYGIKLLAHIILNRFDVCFLLF